MFGYAWLSEQQRKDSPTLDGEMKAYESLTDAITANITSTDSSKAPLVRGFLDFLAYRALRLPAKLSPERAARELIDTIHLLVLGVNRPPE